MVFHLIKGIHFSKKNHYDKMQQITSEDAELFETTKEFYQRLISLHA